MQMIIDNKDMEDHFQGLLSSCRFKEKKMKRGLNSQLIFSNGWKCIVNVELEITI